MKIVINTEFGGFGLSKEAEQEYLRRGGQMLNFHGEVEVDPVFWSGASIARNDAILVAMVEEDARIGGVHYGVPDLAIVEIPDDVEWVINDYDGNEWVAEKHRRWYASGAIDW
jgi:hypothetical protein